MCLRNELIYNYIHNILCVWFSDTVVTDSRHCTHPRPHPLWSAVSWLSCDSHVMPFNMHVMWLHPFPLLHSLVEHSCEECRRVYPSGRLLELHILESHDTLFKLMAANQNMVCTGYRRKLRESLLDHPYGLGYSRFRFLVWFALCTLQSLDYVTEVLELRRLA